MPFHRFLDLPPELQCKIFDFADVVLPRNVYVLRAPQGKSAEHYVDVVRQAQAKKRDAKRAQYTRFHRMNTPAQDRKTFHRNDTLVFKNVTALGEFIPGGFPDNDFPRNELWFTSVKFQYERMVHNFRGIRYLAIGQQDNPRSNRNRMFRVIKACPDIRVVFLAKPEIPDSHGNGESGLYNFYGSGEVVEQKENYVRKKLMLSIMAQRRRWVKWGLPIGKPRMPALVFLDKKQWEQVCGTKYSVRTFPNNWLYNLVAEARDVVDHYEQWLTEESHTLRKISGKWQYDPAEKKLVDAAREARERGLAAFRKAEMKFRIKRLEDQLYGSPDVEDEECDTDHDESTRDSDGHTDDASSSDANSEYFGDSDSDGSDDSSEDNDSDSVSDYAGSDSDSGDPAKWEEDPADNDSNGDDDSGSELSELSELSDLSDLSGYAGSISDSDGSVNGQAEWEDEDDELDSGGDSGFDDTSNLSESGDHTTLADVSSVSDETLNG